MSCAHIRGQLRAHRPRFSRRWSIRNRSVFFGPPAEETGKEFHAGMTEKLERPRKHRLVLTITVITDQDRPIPVDSRVSNDSCEVFDGQEFQRSPVKYS